MRILTNLELIQPSGGIGCRCLPGGVTTVTIDTNACIRTCCQNPRATACVFDNRPLKAINRNLLVVPSQCFPCENQVGIPTWQELAAARALEDLHKHPAFSSTNR